MIRLFAVAALVVATAPYPAFALLSEQPDWRNIGVLSPEEAREADNNAAKERIARDLGMRGTQDLDLNRIRIDRYRSEGYFAGRRQSADTRAAAATFSGRYERTDRPDRDRDPAMARSSGDRMEARSSDADRAGRESFGDRLVDAARRGKNN